MVFSIQGSKLLKFNHILKNQICRPIRRSCSHLFVCKIHPLKHFKYLLPSLKTFLLSSPLSMTYGEWVTCCHLSGSLKYLAANFPKALLSFILYFHIWGLSGSSPLWAGVWKIDILTRRCQTLLIELQAPLERPACLAATLPPLINTCWYFRFIVVWGF